MAGVGLDDGGFHQVLNRLFSEDSDFGNLRAEDKEAFQDYYQSLEPGAERRQALRAVRGLLMRAYRMVLGDDGMVARVAERLSGEMRKIAVEVGP